MDRNDYRANDGLDPTGTSDLRGNTPSYDQTTRRNDGLDTSNISDAYSGGRDRDTTSFGSSTRGNDGLDTRTAGDSYGREDISGFSSGGPTRRNDGLDTTSTSDAYGDTGSGFGSRAQRSGEGTYADPSVGDRTSGGLGYDDTIGSQGRTGGVGRGGDQETSQYTSGGLGQDDTYGQERKTGGADTGMGHNYGMGSGRSTDQERGGFLPTEPGREDIRREEDRGYGGRDSGREDDRGYGGRDDDDKERKKSDSTMGKLMEKTGSVFKNENIQAKGEEKRRQAGAFDDSTGTSGNY